VSGIIDEGFDSLFYLEPFLLLKNPESIPFPIPLPSLDLLVAVELLGLS
jgi:hypothetical protein